MTDTIVLQRLPNMALFIVNALSTREEVIDYYQQQQALLESWPDDHLYLVLHDLSHAQQVPWTPYIRKMAEDLADSIPAHLQGRVAYVLPKVHTSNVIRLFIKRDQNRRSPHVQYEVFLNSDRAIDWLEEALEVEPYQQKADTLYKQGQYNEAIHVYQGMLMAACASSNQPKQARALSQLAWIYYDQGDYETAFHNATEAEVIAREVDATVEIARALQIKGWYLRIKRDLEGAAELGQQALALCQAIDEEETAQCYSFIGTIQQLQHQYADAHESYQQALHLFRDLGLRRDSLTMINKLGSIAGALGDHHKAIGFYRQGLNQAIEMGDRSAEIVTLSFLGESQLRAGDHRQAEETFQNIIRLVESTGEIRGWITYVHISLAIAQLQQGKVNLALDTAIQALNMAHEQQTPGQLASAWRTLGMVAARLKKALSFNGIIYDARTCFGKALDIFTEMNTPVERARTLRYWADYERKHGDIDKSEAMFAEARTIFQALNLTAELDEIE